MTDRPVGFGRREEAATGEGAGSLDAGRETVRITDEGGDGG